MKRLRLIISGDVVGVGFRSWVYKRAREFSVTGWVKNREDDTVELVAEGNRETLEQLAAACKKGPDVAWVKDVTVTWQVATGELLPFKIEY